MSARLTECNKRVMELETALRKIVPILAELSANDETRRALVRVLIAQVLHEDVNSPKWKQVIAGIA